MRIALKHAIMLIGSVGLMGVAAPALAGCGDTASYKPSVWQGDSTNLFRPVVQGPSIVGLWSFQFVSGGKMADFGFSEWHSDGTEIMNSGSRAPSTENFCLGVWAQDGGRYKLNHFALSYDPSGTLNAVVNIKEDVALAGDSYSGSYTLDVYDPHSKALLQHVAGKVVAKRVTIDSGV